MPVGGGLRLGSGHAFLWGSVWPPGLAMGYLRGFHPGQCGSIQTRVDVRATRTSLVLLVGGLWVSSGRAERLSGLVVDAGANFPIRKVVVFPLQILNE